MAPVTISSSSTIATYRSLDDDTIAALCDRHRGIGADGLLAVEPAEKGADYKFRYYNADGGEAEMCGNGARCFGFFTAHLGNEDEELPSSVSFETIAGTLTAEIVGEEVRIAMSEPKDLELNTPAKIDGFSGVLHFLNTGVLTSSALWMIWKTPMYSTSVAPRAIIPTSRLTEPTPTSPKC